ncbi:MAG: hypothetical protein AAF412_06075, partial [Pseudomonadota bacterium]
SLKRIIRELSAICAVLTLAACSPSTSAVEGETAAADGKTSKQSAEQQEATSGEASDAETAQPEKEEETELSRVIKREGKVQNRGVYIKMLVNKNPITNFDLNRRVALLKLRRVPGNRTKLAEKEMIEQILKLQEATRRRTLASKETVDQAFANFAKRNRTTPSQLSQGLSRFGVGTDHFKSFIKTQISWQRAVSSRFQAETINVSEQEAVIQLRDSGSDKPQLTEYNFQQVVFVVPKAQRSSAKLAARRVEANAFRQRFTSCDDTIGQAKALKDVSVIEQKRILEPELPTAWKDEVRQLDQKGTTRVKETNNGMEFLAVCNSKLVNDDRAAQISTQSAEFDSFNEKGSALSDRYLKELKSRATIIYQ